jgi:hypothetical protein
MTSDVPLINSLRKLCALAEQAAGCDSIWLASVADDLVALVLAQRLDPRRRRSLAVARHMAITVEAMQRAGHTNGEAVGALCRRHGLGRSRIYELLKLSGNNAGRIRR